MSPLQEQTACESEIEWPAQRTALQRLPLQIPYEPVDWLSVRCIATLGVLTRPFSAGDRHTHTRAHVSSFNETCACAKALTHNR